VPETREQYSCAPFHPLQVGKAGGKLESSRSARLAQTTYFRSCRQLRIRFGQEEDGCRNFSYGVNFRRSPLATATPRISTKWTTSTICDQKTDYYGSLTPDNRPLRAATPGGKSASYRNGSVGAAAERDARKLTSSINTLHGASDWYGVGYLHGLFVCRPADTKGACRLKFLR
jgi:hypothetical protein